MSMFPGTHIGALVRRLGLPGRLEAFVADVDRFVLSDDLCCGV